MKMLNKISPLAPKSFPDMPEVAGVRLAATNCGIRYKRRYDLMMAEMPKGTTVAGVFTTSSMQSPTIEWDRKILKNGKARALVVNAGIANVFTGKQGEETVIKTAKATAKLLNCRPDEVFISSTGIIGEQIEDELLIKSLPDLKRILSKDSWHAVSSAILTTDTFAKAASRKCKIGDTEITINGFCKGSGMVAPNMATMLAYIFTDAKIPAEILQKMLSNFTEPSFNSVTVDGDMSTSDRVLLFATGQAAHKKVLSYGDKHLSEFKKNLLDIMTELAQLLVRDGEGARKFITINIKGAKTKKAAKNIGLSIANSPLVKTALAAGDPNWGRIVMAVGKSGEAANRNKMSIWIGNKLIAEKGAVNLRYHEGVTSKYMKGSNIEITVDVSVGKSKATIWTCDLTRDYITINADYRS